MAVLRTNLGSHKWPLPMTSRVILLTKSTAMEGWCVHMTEVGACAVTMRPKQRQLAADIFSCHALEVKGCGYTARGSVSSSLFMEAWRALRAAKA